MSPATSPSASIAPGRDANPAAAAAASSQAFDGSAQSAESATHSEANPSPAVRPPAPADRHLTPHSTAAGAQAHIKQLQPPSHDAPSASAAAAAPAAVVAAAATTKQTSMSSKMLFSDIYKSPKSPLSKLRHTIPQPPVAVPIVDYGADLLSKDKARQKEAVKNYLADKVRIDWQFSWPPVVAPPENGEVVVAAPTDVVETALQAQAEVVVAATEPEERPADTMDEVDGDTDDDAESVYSTVSEDYAHFKPRMEWISDLSDEDPPMSLSPFRFDSPEAIGAAVKASVAEKRTQRRRALREEMQWNDGLACFEARRNAWTGARTVRVRTKPVSPTTSFASLSPRRLFFRSSISSAPAAIPPPSHQSPPQRQSNEASAAVSDSSEPSKDGSKDLTAQRSKDSSRSTASPSSVTYPVETLLPIPAPLLPPANPMRASITPAVYISLYEKVIVHALTPSCPVNLSDMIRACVAGWKRDGEWPPKSSVQDPSGLIIVRRKKKAATEGPAMVRRMSLGFLGRGDRGEKAEKEDEGGAGKGIRRSLQRVLGIGHHAPVTNGNVNGNPAGNGTAKGRQNAVGA